MSIGMNRAEQELTKRLVESIVIPEVLRPMDKIGWSHGTPPPPDYTTTVPTEGAPAPAPAAPAALGSGQPAPAAPAPVPAAAAPAKADAPGFEEIVATLESLRDANGLIGGKYKTIPEAFKGMGHLANMAKQSFQERDAALKQIAGIQELGSRPQPVASPAAAPAAPPSSLVASRAALATAKTKLDTVLANLEGDGNVVDAETLRKVGDAQREVAELAADVRVQENFHQRESAQEADRARWTAVDEFMNKNHPESLKHADEIGLHIQSDPVLQEAVAALVASGKELQASVLAWQSYSRAVSDGSMAVAKVEAENKEVDLAAKEQVRQEALARARADAGVVKGSAGGQGIHENNNATGASREEIAALQNQMRMEGDAPGSPAAARFRHLIIGRHLDPALFGGQ
jgi:hypothetical protein